MVRNVSSVPKARSGVRCPHPCIGSPRLCSSESAPRAPLRSVWHLIPRELGPRGALLRGTRLSGGCFICQPHCCLVPCWQRACITLPCSPGPCSPVHYIPGSAVATLRVASLLPAPLGPNPPFTSSARVRSRGENNVMLADVMTKPQ